MDWILVEKLIPGSAKTSDHSVFTGMVKPAEINLLGIHSLQNHSTVTEQVELLDVGWQRCVDRSVPPQDTVPSLPDTSCVWEAVRMPDHYSMDDRLADFHGPVWYRRKISRPSTGDRLTILFDAVDYLADVYLNQTYLGHHEGFFAPFQFDLTEFLVPGESAELIVRVQDPLETISGDEYFPRQRKRWIKGSLSLHPERPGGFPTKPVNDWNFTVAQNPPTGGISGAVKLISTGAVRLDALFVTPLTLDGEFHLAVLLDSSLPESLNVDLALQLRTPDGYEDASILTLEVASGANRIDLESHCPTPKIWKDAVHLSEILEAPLYTLTANIITNNTVTSSQSVRFGFRCVNWNTTPTLHFELNRQKLFLRGVNISPTQIGPYPSPESCCIDLQTVIDANLNFVGLSAHLQSPVFYDIADQMGILIHQEFPLYGAYASGQIENPDFTANATAMVAEMVYLLWNHPSVVCYSLHAAPPYILSRLLRKQYAAEEQFSTALKDKIALKATEFRLLQKIIPLPKSDNPQNDGLNRYLDQALEQVVASIHPNAELLSRLVSGQISDDFHGSHLGGDLFPSLPADVPMISGYGSVHIYQTTMGTTDHWAYPWPPDRSRVNTLMQETWHCMELMETVGAFENYPDLAAFAYATERKSAWMAKYWTETYRILRDHPYSGYCWTNLVANQNWISYGLLAPDRQSTQIYDVLKSANRVRLAATHLPYTLVNRGDIVLPIYLINDTDQEWQPNIKWKLDRLKKCELITAEPDQRLPRWIPHLHGSVVLPVPGALENLRQGEIQGMVPSQSSLQIGSIRHSFTRYGAYQLILTWMENGQSVQNDFTFLVTPDHWEPTGGLAIIDSLELQKRYAFKY